ncbi:MAG: hypothetical protein LIP01_08080, partial [Tannerellaceae bacterium]|nr:hypothetical protein [Tannerellaceae bacterium]
IVVGDFRQAMQNEFGGHGVGFVPIHTPASQFRPTINQKVKGWDSYSLMKHKTKPFTLPGMLYEASGEEASLSCHTVNYYPNLKQANSLKIIYEQNQKTCLHLTYNDCIDTTIIQLPASDKITQYIVKDDIQAAHMKFTQATGFRMLGVALEDESGVIVDNFSLRGNSGMLLERFDPDYCASFNEIRPYDLIILQYGLNMVSEEQLNYSAYRNRMVEVIHHIRKCFPDSDLLLLGVSDRGRVVDSKFETMPAVLGMLHAQRQTAKLAGIPFWNTFGAMGGQNSMVKFVEKGWASKDYTHLSFRGGREVAHALYKALIMEKQFYDEAEKSIH